MKTLARMLTLVVLLGTQSAWSAGEPQAMSRAEFDQLLQTISNWGRWGEDDQLGTLNLITAEK